MKAKSALWHIYIDHHLAPLEFREQAAAFFQSVIRDWQNGVNPPDGWVLLTTCYRVELTVHGSGDLAHWLAQRFREAFPISLGFVLAPDEIFKRLAMITAGALSPTIGEPQIAGQVRKAYLEARHAGTLDHVLDRLFTSVLRCARKIRTETGIQQGHTSIPAYTAALVRERVPDTNASVLIVGTGEMAEGVSYYLMKSGYRHLTVASRDAVRAKNFIEKLGCGHPLVWDFDAVPEYLGTYDVIISATAAPYYLWTREAVEHAENFRTSLIIDLAVPRDVEPSVEELLPATLMTVDDIKHDLDAQLHNKRALIEQAREIARTSAQIFARWYQGQALNTFIHELTDEAERIRLRILHRYLRKLDVDPETRDLMDEMTQYLTRKLVSQSIWILKNSHQKEAPHEMLLVQERG